MLLIIIFFVVLAIVVIFGILDGEFWVPLMVGTLCGFFCAILAFLVLYCSVPDSHLVPGPVQTYELYALADYASYEGHVSGNAFLISGTIDEKLEYRYIYTVDGKGYTVGPAIKADECYINYGFEQPRLEIRTEVLKPGFWKWALGVTDEDAFNTEYIFYLPENAEIIHDFVIDLE